jgi:PhnB protein
MASRLNPYLSFGDNARAAMEFYRDVFGGTLTLMAADTPAGMDRHPGDNISVSLSGDDAEDLRRYWTKLSEGGTVTVPLEKQMWGDEFGMCVDRFGIPWMVNIAQSQA